MKKSDCVWFFPLILDNFSVRCQEDGGTNALRPARAQKLYEQMCLENVFESENKIKNPCMCNFLSDVTAPRLDLSSLRGSEIPCIDGFASTGDDSYPCQNATLLSRIGIAELVSVNGESTEIANDIWGWAASPSGPEIAMIGLMSGTSFVDVTDPVNPVFLGNLPARGNPTFWRDIKTYENFAYIVSENSGHGLQVLDLSQLVDTDLSSGPVVFNETNHYAGFGKAHNIAINEESGYAYIVGSDQCTGGLYMVNLEDPSVPQYAGCFGEDGYVHDAQCVIYRGKDAKYIGREICFACNEDTVTIVDVTDKTRPVQLSRTSYHGVAYTHQGWLTEDHNTFLFGDELDERSSKIKKTTSYVMRVADLENPVIVGSRSAMTSEAVDHNMYTKFGCVYQSNYKAGLRVLEIGDVANSADLTEAAFFDVYPESDSGGFGGGSWSNYPYFPSGNVVVSSIDRGLFVVKVDVDENSFVSTPSPIDECLDESNRCSSFFGWKKGFYMHRAALGGRLCWRRCVVGPQVARSERSGWMCGKSCYDEQSF